MTPVLLIALVLQAADALPVCGSRDRDIGRGFELTQYMFNGASEFQLKYRPQSVRTHGVTETAPFQLMFSQVRLEPPLRTPDSGTGPNVGFANYQFTRPDGVRTGLGRLILRCGDGATLSMRYSSAPPDPSLRVPVSFHAPFYNQAEYQCLMDIRRDGRFAFSVAESDEAEPFVTIDSPIELDWAMREVERRWRADLARAERGECRIVPSPPPPF